MVKILIVTPTYNRLYMQTITSILNQRTKVPYNWYVPRNGFGDGERDSKEVITAKYNDARTVMLQGDYTHMWCVESDMHIPEYALDTLLSNDADIAYGVYVFRRSPYELSAYVVMDQGKGYSLSQVPHKAKEAIEQGSVVDTDGVGLGCTLIKRGVVEEVPFRIGEPVHADTTTSHNDWYFALDTKDTYTCVADFRVLCGHISHDNYTIYPSTEGLVQGMFARFIPEGMGIEPRTEQSMYHRFLECICTPSDMQTHLLTLYNHSYGTVVELGTRYGISTTAFLASPHTERVISLDLAYHKELGGIQSDKWEFYQCDSTHIPIPIERVDTLLIDTEHTYDQVKRELAYWHSYLHKGSRVFFHDVQIPEVHAAMIEYCKDHHASHIDYKHGVGHLSMVYWSNPDE